MSVSNAKRLGVLFLNTGSAAKPEVPEVRQYLREFLMDPRVIDLPYWKRWMIVNLFILPFRPRRTAEAYRKVWTPEGAPLLAISEAFRRAFEEKMPEAATAFGMAYGRPKITEALDTLLSLDLEKIVVFPLFPQYASATTGSVLGTVYRHAAVPWNVPFLSVVPPFYADPRFIQAWEAVAAPLLTSFQPEHVLFSFHGLPERQVEKGDPSRQHCLKRPDCCDVSVPANRWCYRRHCIRTAEALRERLGIPKEKATITFQSRLGNEPWLEPATDATITRLAREGVKRLAVLSPAFVADCLETLEELGIGGKENFLENGGKEYMLVPSLNTHPQWIETAVALVRETCGVC